MSNYGILNDNEYYQGYRFKIYPTDSQKEFIDKSININRFIYNWALEMEMNQYKLYKAGLVNKAKLSAFDLDKELITLRENNEWLKEVPVATERFALRRCLNGFDKFFRKNARYPKFKSKKDKQNNSVQIRNDRFYINHNNIRIEGLQRKKFIDCKFDTGMFSNSYDHKFYNVNITKDSSGYYIGFEIIKSKVMRDNTKPVNFIADNPIGVDLNARGDSRVVLSDGTRYPEPKRLQSTLIGISNLQKKTQDDRNRLNEQQRTNADAKQSNRAIKRQMQLSKKWKKVKDLNENFNQQVTNDIIKNHNPSIIILEDLGVENMHKDHYIATYTTHACFGRFRAIMTYKCDKYNIPLKFADKYYPSSKTCSNCGYIYKDLGSKHEFICPNCGTRIDRDYNAALNLSRLA